MGHNELPFLSIDSAHETADLADQDFDAAVSLTTIFNANELRKKAQVGDRDVLADLEEELSHRLGVSGVTADLIQAALAYGLGAAGQMITDLIEKAVEALAEVAALKEVESRVTHH